MISLPRVIAHRGACGYAPENTLAAMHKAKACGATWVEFDVMLSKDEQAVIMHDENLERTTNGVGSVQQMTYAELSDLDAGSWFNHEFAGEKIPSLIGLIDCLKTLNLAANIEIKPKFGSGEQTTRVIVDVIKNHWPKELPQPVISSFDWSCLYLVRELMPDAPLGLLLHRWRRDWPIVAEELQCISVHVTQRFLNQSKIQMIKEQGYLALSYTVNSVERAEQLFKWGLDCVFSDYPDLMTQGS